jgi:hypothetical protein|tara:strand:+ start:1028 stop:1216 length:189 start_codon:yes stop_codon:yes gene_type:complete
MSQEQFNTIIARLDASDARLKNVEDNMVKKSDVFQSVLTVQGFTFAVIVGMVVVLNALGAFG